MPTRPESDGGLGYLEQKLGLFIQGPSQTRRNAALDVLTGRVADERAHTKSPPVPISPTRTHDRVAYHYVRGLRVAGEAPRSTAATWPEVPQPRLRIVHASPPRSARRPMLRWLLLASVCAGVVLTAGLGVRGFLAPVAVESAVGGVPIDVVPADVVAPQVSVDEPTVVPGPATPVPARVLGALVDEHFTSNARGWPDDPGATAWLAGGTYHMAARTATQFVAVGIPGTQALGDEVVSGWFRKVGGPPGGGYGLILRDQDPDLRDGRDQSGHYYVFEVGDRGEVGVWLRDGARWIDLLTWTHSDAVKPGTADNELTVTAAGDHLSFDVNGVPVASQTDAVLRTGAAGVFVGGDGNEVALDRIAVSAAR